MPRSANRAREQQEGAGGILRFWKEQHCVRTRCYGHDFHPLPEHRLVIKQNQGKQNQEEELGPEIKVLKKISLPEKNFLSGSCTTGSSLYLDLFAWANKQWELLLKLRQSDCNTWGLSCRADGVLSKVPQLLNLLVPTTLDDLTCRCKMTDGPKCNTNSVHPCMCLLMRVLTSK